MTAIKTYPANIEGNTTEVTAGYGGEHVVRLSAEHKPSELAPEASLGSVDLMIWGEPNMLSDGCDLLLTDLSLGEADTVLSGLIEALTAQREALRKIAQA